MKAAYGYVRQVKKQLSTGLAIIEVEVSVEAYKDAVQLLDGQLALVTVTGDMGGNYRVLDSEDEPEPPPPSRKFKDLPPSQQAALRCKEPVFQEWVEATSEDDCIAKVYDRCGIQSRRELDTPGNAQDNWVALESAFWGSSRYPGDV